MWLCTVLSLTLRLGIKDTVVEPYFMAALSLAVAVLSWHLIEQPILRLKKWVPYRKRVSIRSHADDRITITNAFETGFHGVKSV